MTLELASPWVLLLWLVLPFFVMQALGFASRGKAPAMRYADLRLVRFAHKRINWRVKGSRIKPFLRILGLAVLILALARPQWVDARQIVKGEGVDIALAVDISGSMASLDFQPDNRLEAAKQVIADFIGQRPYDRIGVTVFASEAFMQSPLTIDHQVVGRLLESLDLAPNLNIEDGTAIGLGLATAANMLKDSDAKSRVAILLTDGVHNAGQIDPLTAAEAAKALGIKVYTIGMGKPGLVPMPKPTIFGEQVVMVESQLDEETLQQIAEITGGRFFRAYDTQELAQVYDEINQLEKSKIEIQRYDRTQELANWLLAPALILLLVEMFLRKTVLRTIP